jgi:glycosyltransferase involved in cell wall biosynthesis
VSNGSPHKNEVRTVRAFAASGLARTHDLLLTGEPRPLGPAAESVLPRFLGRVDDRRLAELYRGAVALVFVSLYEGFGLPAAEAMACGTPVLCSRGGALEEITADAALHVNPESVADIAAGLERIVQDAPLRSRLRAAGPARAGRFDWDAGAARLQSLLGLHVAGV